MSFEDILNRHDSHQVVILPRYHKGKPRLIPGLYCVPCGKLIKWLAPDLAHQLHQAGVELIEPSKLDKIKHLRDQAR